MARIEIDPNYTSPTFARATAATDIFKKEDVQGVAAALSTHVHDGVHGLAIAPPAGSVNGSVITDGTITSAKIADGTIDTVDLKDGSVTSAKIADGTIATADHADASVTNAKLASDTARANLLTNGGFEIWQRGNGPFTASAYICDRWNASFTGTDTFTLSRDTANVDAGSTYCAAFTFTLGTGAGGSSFQQGVRGVDISGTQGRTVSFSIRVKTSTANALQARIICDGTGGGVANGTMHSGGGTYQTLTATLAVPVNATYVIVYVPLLASCTAYLDNAMLVVGSQPADYAPLHPADDLARCLRYYEVIGDTASYPVVQGYQGAGGAIYNLIPYVVRKAVAPTVTKNGTWVVSNCGQPSITVSAPLAGCTLNIVATAVGYAYANAGAVGQNLSIESNP